MTTVFLADDHAIVRQGLRLLLEAEPDLDVVGEAGDGLETLRQVERLVPEILVLDLMMPGLHGLEVVRRLEGQRQTRVVVLSMHASEVYVVEALRNGAAGYVLKGSQFDELVRAIREVAAGRRYLSPPLSDRVVDVFLERQGQAAVDRYETLTSREREVLQLAAEGLPNHAIAARLFIGVRTVETHRAHLMRKLSLRNQAELVRYAIQRGLVSGD